MSNCVKRMRVLWIVLEVETPAHFHFSLSLSEIIYCDGHSPENTVVTQCWFNVGPASSTLAQY